MSASLRPRRSLREQVLHALDSWELSASDRARLEAMLREETELRASAAPPAASAQASA